VPEPPVDRLAATRVPIHPDLAARWSPRAFDPDAIMDRDDLLGLLEAARWAATWGARQPVRFLVGMRGSDSQDTFTALAGLLKRGNSYAFAASALILLCADDGPDERTAVYSRVDAGSALANLSIEAVARALHAHPMAGFDAPRAREVFALPVGLSPLMVIAVGTLGDYARVPDEIAERDARARHRLPLEEIVLNWPV
jgi:nitroreductase